MKHPESYNTSKAGYYADFVVAPIMFVIGILLAPHTLAAMAYGAVGFMSWTLAEYGIHRWIFHGNTPFKRDHIRHHRNPAPYIAASPLITWPIFAGLLGLLYLIGDYGGAVFAGMVAGYFVYIAAHDAMHHPTRLKVALMRRYLPEAAWRHELHHDHDVRTNFGIAFPLWDHFFGTYRR